MRVNRSHLLLLTRQSRLHHSLAGDFGRRDHGRWTWMVRQCGADSNLDVILMDPDAVLAARAEFIKSTDCSTIGRVAGYVIKTWVSHGAGGWLKDCVRGPRAERAGLKALELLDAGIPTAEPLAWGRGRGWDRKARSVLVMKELTGTVDLGQWKGDRLQMSGRFGRLIGILHRRGFTHRDLKPTNLLLTPDGSPYLIDLDGLRRPGSVSRHRAVADLVKLARRMVELSTLSPKEASRFVAGYASERGGPSRRNWWKSLKADALCYREFRPRSRSSR